MDATTTFELHRDRLFGVAYRMTGSVADAFDICQDAWFRWQTVDVATVDNAEAFLVRVATRLAIDRARSAQSRRETYVGPYLPEPIVGGEANGPEAAAILADSMTFAFLVVLDELSPIERAVFLLHDVFGYSFDEIALSVDRAAPACRQIASRTRKRIDQHSVELRRVTGTEEEALIAELIRKTASGDITGLMTMLAPDVVQLDDAGALRRAARYPIVGRERVARFMVNLTKRNIPGITFETTVVNGTTGILFRLHGEPNMVINFAFSPDRLVRRIFVQLNHDKLQHLAPSGRTE